MFNLPSKFKRTVSVKNKKRKKENLKQEIKKINY